MNICTVPSFEGVSTAASLLFPVDHGMTMGASAKLPPPEEEDGEGQDKIVGTDDEPSDSEELRVRVLCWF